MPIQDDLANAERLPAGSADQMTAYGAIWHVYVWMAPDNGTGGNRDLIINSLNGRLARAGVRVTRGFQPYDPVVRRGRPQKYLTLAAALSAGADGGAGQAQALLQWMNGNRRLDQLGNDAQDFAIITHFAEQARGYPSEIPNLQNRLSAIANAATAAAASQGWQDLATQWAPVLTYAQDSRTDFVPDDDSDDSVSDDDAMIEDDLTTEDEDGDRMVG